MLPMAFDILDRISGSDQPADCASASPLQCRAEQLGARDVVSANLAQAASILGMMLYQFPTAPAPQAVTDDLLRCALPLARLMESAAREAPAIYPPCVVMRIEELASMGRMLENTVKEEALGQSLDQFRWLSEFLWALEAQVDEVRVLL
jgi:hypothetical protein